MQRHGFDGNTDLYQAKTQENKMLLLYSSVNNTGYFHLHTGKICIKELKSINCKLSQKLSILIGTCGDVAYSDIEKASIANEDAKFKGKSAPFAHQVLGGVTFMSIAAEPSLYVGIKLTLKDHSVRAIYISDIKTQFNTSIYQKDKEEADKILQLIQDRI